MFIGFVELGNTLQGAFQVAGAGLPADADVNPTARVYGPDGYVGNATVAFLAQATIVSASLASPVVVTCPAHGLTTGARVTVAGVVGNSGANGTFIVTVVDADHFSLNGSTGTGAGTGGSWHLTGVYSFTVTASGTNGFESGQNYAVVEQWTTGGTAGANLDTFQVA